MTPQPFARFRFGHEAYGTAFSVAAFHIFDYELDVANLQRDAKNEWVRAFIDETTPSPAVGAPIPRGNCRIPVQWRGATGAAPNPGPPQPPPVATLTPAPPVVQRYMGPGVDLFFHCDYQGYAIRDVKPGTKLRKADLGPMYKNLSSFIIPKGLLLRLYTGDNLDGQSIIFPRSFIPGYNEVIRSNTEYRLNCLVNIQAPPGIQSDRGSWNDLAGSLEVL